jgi:hypothetical protein
VHTQNATTAVRVVKPQVRYFQLLLLCKVGNGRNTTSPAPSFTTHPTRGVGFPYCARVFLFRLISLYGTLVTVPTAPSVQLGTAVRIRTVHVLVQWPKPINTPCVPCERGNYGAHPRILN